MKRSFCISLLVSVFSTCSLYASEESDDFNSETVLLLEHGNFDRNYEYNVNFAFNNPRIELSTPISDSVPLDRICAHFKAGNALGADYSELVKKGKFDNGKRYLTFLQNEKWMMQKAPAGSRYIVKIYCGEPSREYALKLIMNELHKSQGGSRVDFEFFKKIYKLYPDMFTVDLCLKFLVAEQSHRYIYYNGYWGWNYNPAFVKAILGIYPELADDVGRI